MKVLLVDGTGLCIYQKRLEQGRFAPLWERRVAEGAIELTLSELALYLEGSRLAARMALSSPKCSHKSLTPLSRL